MPFRVHKLRLFFILVVLALIVLLGVLLVKTFRYPSRQVQVAAAPEVPVDATRPSHTPTRRSSKPKSSQSCTTISRKPSRARTRHSRASRSRAIACSTNGRAKTNV